jgi:hypothetical protein
MRENTHGKKIKFLSYLLICVLVIANCLFISPNRIIQAADTQIQYLSGTDKDNTVNWDFYLSSGRGSGTWTTIKVPGCIETQGFGAYAYHATYSNTGTGSYKYNFNVSSAWSGKKVSIVFEGAGKDTSVKINGVSAGATHQGSYYRFKYDVTSLLSYGASNLLEVDVTPNSANASVNSAENGDYWSFWGIMRPVYLEMYPLEFIERTAINAKADGTFSMDVYLNGITSATNVTAQIKKLDGTNVGSSFSTTVAAGNTKKTLTTTISSPLKWNAEDPNLYKVEVVLNNGATEIHKVTSRFGFRTLEVRANDGLYINGVKVKGIRGFDRHCFWPTTGRTTSPAADTIDMNLWKEINANASRSSHYPPDVNWLDLCDEKGIYVLDELGGWQNSYDTTVGQKLVKETVTRDVNHPCVIFWDNGNEGGWNTAVDGDFGLWDPQARAVLHPWTTFSNVNTNHYPDYSTDITSTALYMPTEFDHAVGDGGGGASLNDYWRNYMLRPGSIGGFIWAFLDEGVVRTDRTPQNLDCGSGNNDGIVGPYREKEGSFNTIKEIWSPIYIEMNNYKTLPANFDGNITIANRYDFTNSNQCTFGWKLVNFNTMGSGQAGYNVLKTGTPASPSIAPHASGTLSLGLPSDWNTYDALYLTATDKNAKELYTWTWTVKKAVDHKNNIVTTTGATAASGTSDASYITVTANGVQVKFSKTTGRIASVTKDGIPLSFTDGVLTALNSSGTESATTTFSAINGYQSGNDYCVDVTYNTAGNMKYAYWRLYPSGWLKVEYKYNLGTTGTYQLYGMTFNFPESKINGMRYLGKGPYRVWKNRMKGVTANLWQKNYNTTERGLINNIPVDGYTDPIEFRGFYSNMYWVDIDTDEGPIKVVTENEDLFFQMGQKPSNMYLQGSLTNPGFASGTFSFLDTVPPIGDKFKAPSQLGPEAAFNTPAGDYIRTLYFKFEGGGTTPTPSPTPGTPTPTPTPGTFIITNMTVNDTANAVDWSIRGNIQAGNTEFGDRTYTITSLPAAYAGCDWIRSANDSKGYAGTSMVTFNVTVASDVLVAHDDRITTKPSWLSGWTDTGSDIIDDEGTYGIQTFSLYKKSFAANALVDLGPDGSAANYDMYYVIVKSGATATSTPTPTPATTATPTPTPTPTSAATPTPTPGTVTLIDENFNSQTTGNQPSGWTVTNAASTTCTIAEIPSLSDKSMKFYDNNTAGFSQAQKAFTAQTGQITAEWKFMEESAAGKWPKFFFYSGGTVAIEMYVNPSFNLVYRDNTATDITVQGTVANTWYTVKIIAKPGTDTFDIYVNGTLKVTGAPFRNAVSNIDSALFGSGGSPTGTVYIDNVKVTAP